MRKAEGLLRDCQGGDSVIRTSDCESYAEGNGYSGESYQKRC